MKKGYFITFASLLLPHYLCSQENRLNVVFIMADDLGLNAKGYTNDG
ncbi:hypothetical protein [Bacteroides caecigallinarum]|nr:hypothetical protein [Bacteroides caecigallinarum]MCF2551527.1 hypothetical protein [Bacteroides caecigallinarum]